MSLLGSKKSDHPNWFEAGLLKKVGLGIHTSFWEDPWIENILLRLDFKDSSSSPNFRMDQRVRWEGGKRE